MLAESLTRPRLADIYELAGRLLVSTALAFCLAGIFYLFVMVIGGFDTMYLNAVLAAIVFLVLFEPLQSEVETRIHQFFFRERYDLETSVAELRRYLAHVLEIDEMVGTLMQGLERSRRVTTAALYLRDQDGDGYDLAGSIGAAVQKRIEAVAATPLLDRLEKQPSLSFEELAREASKEDGPAVLAATATLGARCAAPSCSRSAPRTTRTSASSSSTTTACATRSPRRRSRCSRPSARRSASSSPTAACTRA